MSTVLRPVGPNPPRVYWIRRLVVLVVLGAVVVGGVVLARAVASHDGTTIGAARVGAAAAPSQAATPSQATTPSQTATPSPAATPVDCTAAHLKLTLAATAGQYAAGVNPVLKATVTNTGTAPCTVDAGDAAREVVVSSGADRIWSTKDCASADTASKQVLLAAGARETKDISWRRVRSASGCPANLQAPRTGTYQAVATLLGTSAPTVTFVLQ